MNDEQIKEAMRHGWDCAIERMAELLPEELYARPVPARYITNEAIEEMAEDFLSTDGDEAPLVVGYVEFARAIEAALMGESDV